MEGKIAETTTTSRLLTLAPRVGAIILAAILIAFSAATIGIIENNETFDVLRDHSGTLSDNFEDLLILIIRSLGVSGWLIFIGAGVIVAEAIAILLAILNIQIQTLRLAIQIIEIIFSVLVALSYGSSGIACAAYAAAWGKPPKACEDFESRCDIKPLTATMALAAVFSFIEAAVLICVAVLIILTIMKSRRAT